VSASRTRTRFAAPFIITVAAAGCSKGEPTSNPPPPKRAFPGVTYSVRMQDMSCIAEERWAVPDAVAGERPVPPNPPPPRAIECPPGMAGNTVFVVGELAKSECAIVPAGCDDTSCAKIRTPCPLPPGEKLYKPLANLWLIEKRGDKCHAEEGDEDKCPPGNDCNPPAPRFVPCPPGITEADPVRIAELPDATCVTVPPGCKDTSCIGGKIACPTESPR
jgi:hypothetical protein